MTMHILHPGRRRPLSMIQGCHWPQNCGRTAVPVPMATPMSAFRSAGASFTPSPVMATTCPWASESSTLAAVFLLEPTMHCRGVLASRLTTMRCTCTEKYLRLQHLDQSLLVAGLHAAEHRHALQRHQLLLGRQLVELQACATMTSSTGSRAAYRFQYCVRAATTVRSWRSTLLDPALGCGWLLTGHAVIGVEYKA